MSIEEYASGGGERRLSPADVRNVRFPRAPMLHPGYSDAGVDRFMYTVADEIARLHAEKAELRDQVHALQDQARGVEVQVAPSEQAMQLLASAQQTADEYVAEAEDFSRQMTSDARAQYEEQLRRARENAGAILQAAQEAAARVAGGGSLPRATEGEQRSTEQLEEQVAYLKAFAQACRVQLRSYLEALLTDVEAEWGRADPASLAHATLRTSAQRSDRAVAPVPPAPNVAREVPIEGSEVEVLGSRQ